MTVIYLRRLIFECNGIGVDIVNKDQLAWAVNFDIRKRNSLPGVFLAKFGRYLRGDTEFSPLPIGNCKLLGEFP